MHNHEKEIAPEKLYVVFTSHFLVNNISQAWTLSFRQLGLIVITKCIFHRLQIILPNNLVLYISRYTLKSSKEEAYQRIFAPPLKTSVG